jgi:hypothetical protein
MDDDKIIEAILGMPFKHLFDNLIKVFMACNVQVVIIHQILYSFFIWRTLRPSQPRLY